LTTRRAFIAAILGLPFAKPAITSTARNFTWDKTRVEFFDNDKLMLINGIAYHEVNATIGTWNGIIRSTYPHFKSTRNSTA